MRGGDLDHHCTRIGLVRHCSPSFRMPLDLCRWTLANYREAVADGWGSRGCRFKSCQPDSGTAGQRRVARRGRPASGVNTATGTATRLVSQRAGAPRVHAAIHRHFANGGMPALVYHSDLLTRDGHQGGDARRVGIRWRAEGMPVSRARPPGEGRRQLLEASRLPCTVPQRVSP